MLVAFAGVVLVAMVLLRAYRLDKLRSETISSLAWGGGSEQDQAALARIRGYVKNSSRTMLLTPKIVAVTCYPGTDGFIVGVDWIGLDPDVNSVRFVFADATACILPICDRDCESHKRLSARTLLFETSFADLEFPSELRTHLLGNLESVTLMRDGIARSEHGHPPTYVHESGYGGRELDDINCPPCSR